MNPDRKYVNPTKENFDDLYRSKDRWFFCDCRFGSFRLRSGLENLFLIRCHYDKKVIDLKYETIRVPYVDDTGKSRKTIPDFLINHKHLIEIKPLFNQQIKLVQIKYKAMTKYCEDKNMTPHMLCSKQYEEFFAGLAQW